MNAEQKIDRLEQEIRKLAARQSEDQHRLQQLFNELVRLKISGPRPGDIFPAPVARASDGLPLPVGGSAEGHPVPGQPPGQQGLEQFIGLKLIHLAGIIVLLTGISIGVKYAIDQDLISPLARILLAYAASGVLLVLSWKLAKNYRFFSAILFSGSMAAAYFTTFASLAYYAMLTVPVAFAIMALLTAFTIYRSLYYNRIEIAAIGLVGAYGIPFLVSNNTGRIEMFFGYVSLINVAVVYLAYRKGWRMVSMLALSITWLVLIGWLLIDYSGKHLLVAVVYTVLFYFLFLTDTFSSLKPGREPAIPVDRVVATARGGSRATANGPRTMVALLLNGLLLLSLVLVFGRDAREPMAETATVMVLAAVQAALLRQRLPGDAGPYRLLAGQAICFLVLLIGLSWNGVTVTGLWILLSILLFVVGVVLNQSWLRLFGVVLVAGTLFKLVTIDAIRFTAGQRIFSYIGIGTLLLIGSFYYQRFNQLNRNISKSESLSPGKETSPE